MEIRKRWEPWKYMHPRRGFNEGTPFNEGFPKWRARIWTPVCVSLGFMPSPLATLQIRPLYTEDTSG